MKLIRRTRPVAVAAEPQTASVAHAELIEKPKPKAPQMRTALRTSSAHVKGYSEARAEIMANLKLISDSNAQIDAATANIDAATAKIDALMRLHKIEAIDNGDLAARLAEKFSKQGRKIDVKKFRAQVTQDTFYECVTVSISKAEEYLGQKQLNAVCDIEPSKSLGTKLEIKEIKKK